NIRVVALGVVDDLGAAQLAVGVGGTLDEALLGTHDVVFDADGRPETHPTPFYNRGLLTAGQRIEGPCVLEQYDSTTVVPPGFTATIDEHGNVVIACPVREADTPEESANAELATPILMRIIGGAFLSIAKEMASVLFRMSYSSIIRESEDLGAGIFDVEGNMLAESDSTPMFMGSMPKIVRGAMRHLGGEIDEGDVILHNDPYLGTTHSPDVAVIMPI